MLVLVWKLLIDDQNAGPLQQKTSTSPKVRYKYTKDVPLLSRTHHLIWNYKMLPKFSAVTRLQWFCKHLVFSFLFLWACCVCGITLESVEIVDCCDSDVLHTKWATMEQTLLDENTRLREELQEQLLLEDRAKRIVAVCWSNHKYFQWRTFLTDW